jgi:hypothetical protein
LKRELTVKLKNNPIYKQTFPEINYYHGYAKIPGNPDRLYGEKNLERFESLLNLMEFINNKDLDWTIGFLIDHDWNPDDPNERLSGVLFRIKKTINSIFGDTTFIYKKKGKWKITISENLQSNALNSKTLYEEVKQLIETDPQSAKNKIKRSIKKYPSIKNDIYDLKLKMNVDNNFDNAEYKDIFDLQKVSDNRYKSFENVLKKLIEFRAKSEIIESWNSKIEFFKKYLPKINEWIENEENEIKKMKIKKNKIRSEIDTVVEYIKLIRLMQKHKIMKNEVDRKIKEYLSLYLIKRVKQKLIAKIKKSQIKDLEIGYFEKLVLECGENVVETVKKRGFPNSTALVKYYVTTIFYGLIDKKNEDKDKLKQTTQSFNSQYTPHVKDPKDKNGNEISKIIEQQCKILKCGSENEKNEVLLRSYKKTFSLFELLERILKNETLVQRQQILDGIQEIFFEMVKKFGSEKLLKKIDKYHDPKVKEFCKRIIK